MAQLSKKKRSRSDASTAAAPAPEEDVPFPRGGASLLTPLEERKLHLRAKADFEREVGAARGPATKKKRKSSSLENDVEDSLFKIQSASGDLPKFVDLLRFAVRNVGHTHYWVQNLSIGGKIWGVLLEVTPRRLVVSLPLGLRGTVSPADASDVLAALGTHTPSAEESELRAAVKGPAPSLESLFYPGQFVRCVVKALDAPAEKKEEKAGKKRIHLSLKVSDVSSGIDKASLHVGAVVPAVIRTVEDHGSVLSLGIKGVAAFLPSASYTTAFGPAVTPLPGQLLQVVIKQLLRGGSSAIVGCEPAEVAEAALTAGTAITIGALLPGHLVTVTVRRVLSDGLVVSFLKYFHGSIDRFHLPQDQLSKWRTAITPGMRLRARILYISPADKLVRLSLLKNLISYHLPMQLPPLGAVLDPVHVFRPDPAVGVLCTLPADYSSLYGYIHISNLRDGKAVASNVSKDFPAGTELRAKVIGFRPMDALVTLTARASAVESSNVNWETLQAGMVLDGRVHAVEDFGVTVQLTPEIRGLVPLAHLSDAGVARKLSSKFKAGQTVRVRAIDVENKRKRVLLSMKKGVLGAKTPPLLSADAAEQGLRTHGWVTGVTAAGVFIGLYNKLKGLVPAKSVDLPAGATLQDAYAIGQVVKCTVVGQDASKGLRLSFSAAVSKSLGGTEPTGSAGMDPGGLVEGSVVENAVVTEVERFEDDEDHVRECTLALEAPSGVRVNARMDRLHFSDHAYGCELISASLHVGAVIPRVVVLEHQPRRGHVVVSRKAALVAAAEAGLLPAKLEDAVLGQHVTGYVSSMTDKSCFIRFLGRCTGRAAASQLGDDHVALAQDAYKEGQTVHTVILDVNKEKGQMTVSLKPSQTARSDCMLLTSLFQDMKLAATMAGVDTSVVPVIGSVITVPVTEMRDYGLVCGIPEDSENLVGLIAKHQLASADVNPGDSVEAAVLDVNELDGIVDLSASPGTVQACQRREGSNATSTTKVGDTISAKVLLVKSDADFLVVSVEGNTAPIGFVPACDYNVQRGNIKRTFEPGENIMATVVSLPGPATGNRLLLHTSLLPAKRRPAKGSAVKSNIYPAGTIVTGTITSVHDSYAQVSVEGNIGRLNAAEVQEVDVHTSPVGTKPLSQLKTGGEVRAVVLPHNHHLSLSLRPSAIVAAETTESASDFAETMVKPLAVGQVVAGVVDEAKAEHLYVSLPNERRVRVHCLHASPDPEALACLPEKFAVGVVVRGRLLEVDMDRKHVSMTLLPSTFAPLSKGGPAPKEGQLVMGKVQSASGSGVWCWLANGAVATASLTELHDQYVPNALQGLKPGTFVRAAVAKLPSKAGKLKITLRQSRGCSHSGHAVEPEGPDTPKLGDETSFRKGQTVHGYVRSVQPAKSKGAGLYVSLADDVVARIQLRNLSDTYVEDPVKSFPEGMHISARVIKSQDGRIEMTCKTAKPSGNIQGLEDFSLGQELKGTVTRAEPFGIFVRLEESNLTGLVHVSEISGKFVRNVPAEYPPGRKVRAVVLSIDKEKGRLALGMQAKYFLDETPSTKQPEDTDMVATVADTAPKSVNVDVEKALLAAYDESDDDSGSGSDDEAMEQADGSGDEALDIPAGGDAIKEDLESDDDAVDAIAGGNQSDEYDLENDSDDDAEDDQPQERPGVVADPYGWDALVRTDTAPVKETEAEEATTKSKRAKKKAREEQEAAVRKAELAKLQDAPPGSTEDYERLVLGSPNSSYIWIRYMAFLLGMAEVVKARAVAERALKTIDHREQGDKHSVWVAYLNLENSFADDPVQSVAALLKRAVQQNDAKKMYLAAIDIFQRSQRKELLDTCAKTVRKKFRESCKVWLRLVKLALGDSSPIGSLLEQATQALPKRKHVKFLSRAALLEFKEGSPDRGRSVFENILQTYPKRTDVWGMYIDQEIKQGKIERVRNLFERSINLNLNAKRMRYFFKRYLTFEEEHGTPEKVEYVKRSAMEFIQGHTGNVA